MQAFPFFLIFQNLQVAQRVLPGTCTATPGESPTRGTLLIYQMETLRTLKALWRQLNVGAGVAAPPAAPHRWRGKKASDVQLLHAHSCHWRDVGCVHEVGSSLLSYLK